LTGRTSDAAANPTAGDGVRTLFPQDYDRLRLQADGFVRNERSNRELQGTALVHEAFVRLSEGTRRYASEAEFVAIAAAQMRHVLVDSARRAHAIKESNIRIGACPSLVKSRPDAKE
jgi:DNA-directed RNA polymerase specialized sigma24 family protein